MLEKIGNSAIIKFKGQKGSHKSYYHSGINERMTIQNANSKAKGYQVRQLRNIINKHGL